MIARCVDGLHVARRKFRFFVWSNAKQTTLRLERKSDLIIMHVAQFKVFSYVLDRLFFATLQKFVSFLLSFVFEE